MRDVWDRIEAVLRTTAPEILAALPAGASLQATAAAEAHLGFALPADVRESYAVHDGSGDADLLPHRASHLIGVPLLSLNEAVRTRQMWLEFLDRGPFGQPSPAGPIRRTWWNPRWVPVTWDGGGTTCASTSTPPPVGRPAR